MNSNSTFSEIPEQQPSPSPSPSPSPPSQPMAEVQARLLSMPIQNENDALNIIVSFLNIAQRRGAFSFDESAKIWDCIKRFQRQQQQQP